MGKYASLIKAYLAVLLVGLIPAWMILLPLDMTSDPEGWQVLVRANGFAVPIAQLLFVLIAMRSSYSPFRSISQLPRLTVLALLAWLAITCFVSFGGGKDHLTASIALIKLFIAGLFFLALINLRTTSQSLFLTRIWVALGTGVVLYTILWAIHIFLVSPQGEDWMERIPGVNNVRHTGHFAIACVIAGLATVIAFWNSPNFWLRWALPLLFSSAGLGLALWTGSRGPLLASLVTMFLTFCIAGRQRKIVARFCITSALAATAIVATLPLPHESYGIAQATGMADVAVGKQDLSSGRLVLWTKTLHEISEKPILGWGLNQFVKFGPSVPVNFLHPHNMPLQMLFSGGIVSVLLTFLIFVPTLWRLGWPYTKGIGAAGVGGIVGMLVYSLYDGALYFSYPTMILLIAIVSSIAPAPEQPVHDK